MLSTTNNVCRPDVAKRASLSSGTLQQAAPGTRKAVAPVRIAVLDEVMVDQRYAPSYYRPAPIDVVALNKRLESRAKAAIAMEEREIQARPVVKIRIQKQLALGESLKLVGMLPEFGRFVPEVAPFMKWSDGHVWTFEGRVRPGVWSYKLVLRRADGAYIWEEGPDRVLKVENPRSLDLNVNINGIKLPGK